MLVWNPSEPFPAEFASTAVAIGNFDGVHRGHAEILRQLKETGLKTVVFTFEPHPMQLLCPLTAPERLTWTERKVELLEAQGVDCVVVCPTSLEMLQWSAREFFDRVLRKALRAKSVVEGSTFTFGRNREGSPQTLLRLCQEYGLQAHIVESQHLHGETISSSRVRRILRDGDIALANEMLTAPYRIRGRVVNGERRGRLLGFPTANLADVDTLLPAFGAYAGRAYSEFGIHAAAICIGPNVTFQEDTPKVEIHLLDFTGDLYDKTLQVEFLARLRPLTQFSSPEALMAQLKQDVADVRAMVG